MNYLTIYGHFMDTVKITLILNIGFDLFLEIIIFHPSQQTIMFIIFPQIYSEIQLNMV